CTTDAFYNLQKENNHLFDFIEAANIGYVPDKEMTAKELWVRLEHYYTQTGTLTIDSDNNRRTWSEQVRPSDKNVKGINQVIARIAQLFPKAVKGTRYCDIAKRNIPVLKGIGILEVARTTLDETRTTSAPLTAPETSQNQDFRTTRTTFSDLQENNIEESEMKIELLSPPMEKEEYATSTGAGDAEPLLDMENCCGESCVTGADQLESGAGQSPSLGENSYSLLQIEKDGGDIAGFVGCQVEVRSLSGAVKFAGEMINCDSKNGIVTVATEQGNRDASLCETFVID
nr:heavy metal transporter [Nostoc sp. ChiQUE02]